MNPLLSIVIANYNFGKYLEDAILSILSQKCDEVELIVVDGGSTDNSVEIVKKYADKLAWWVSEKDEGQSDAFNKGFAHANGKYLTWVNADDVMPQGCLAQIIHEMKRSPNCEWFTGNFFRFNEADHRISQVNWGPHFFPECLQTRRVPVLVYGPSTFFSRKVYEEVGRIGVDYRYSMDTDLWVKFIVRGVKQRRINCFCWAFRMHTGSKTAECEGRQDVDRIKKSLSEEHDRTSRRENYSPSTLIKFAVYVWRVFDGSLVWLLLMRMFLNGRTYKEGPVQ